MKGKRNKSENIAKVENKNDQALNSEKGLDVNSEKEQSMDTDKD